MKRPLLPVALLYCAGIILGNLGEAWLAGLFAAGFLFGLGALVWARARPWLLGGLALVCGWTNLERNQAVLSPHDVRLWAGDRPWLVTVRGRLSGSPSPRVYVREEREAWHTLAVLDLAEARFERGGWQPIHGQVQTTTPGVLPASLRDGQTVEVEGVLALPPRRLADGLFDYRVFLERQGIYYQLKADSTNAWRVFGALRPASWSSRFNDWAMATLERGLPERDQALRLQWAMILGWRTALTDEVSEPFMRSGTMHIFAISGLHIALIAGMLLALCRLVNLPRGWCGVLIIPLIWFYTAATEWQPSAIRSTVMMTVIIAGWSLRRPSDLLNSLAVAGLAILLWDPRQLVQASFQLSFFVVLSLALFGPPLDRFRRWVFDPDPIGEPPPIRFLIPERVQKWLSDRNLLGKSPPAQSALLERFRWRLLGLDPWRDPAARPGWQQLLHGGLDHLTRGLATSMAAFLGSAPLIAYYFHLLTPVSLVANLVVVPVSGLALMAGLGSLLAGAWWPWAAELCNHSGWFWMQLMIWVSEAVVRWPGSYWYVEAPRPVTMALCYAVLVAGLGGWLTGRWRWWTAGGLGLLAVLWAGLAWQDRQTTRVTILPLNGGHAVFVAGAGRREDLLVDCGDGAAINFITTPFLRARGVNRLSRLLLTHGDARHVDGAPGLFTNLVVRELLTGGPSFRSPAYRQAVSVFTNRFGPVRPVRSGDRIGAWQVLHPGGNSRSALADDDCVVLRGQFAGTTLLLCADLSPRGCEALARNPAGLRADLVVAGLPVRGEPLPDFALDLIQPHLVILADSTYPAAARAGEPLRFRLARRQTRFVCTGEAGAITLELHRGGWKVLAADREL